MPELQEVSEKMFFCATEVCHLGTAGRPAENCDKAYDQQFAKVVPRVVGAGIGDVIEGGEENIHVGNGLQKGGPHPRIHPAQDRKTPQITSNPKRDSPATYAATSLERQAIERGHCDYCSGGTSQLWRQPCNLKIASRIRRAPFPNLKRAASTVPGSSLV